MLKKYHKFIILAGVLAIFCLAALTWSAYAAPARLEVAILDVGQGDSILVKTPAGQNILIDGGPDKTVLERLAENLAWWDRKLDLVILTHPDGDHLAGLVDVFKRYRVSRLAYSGQADPAPAYEELLRIVRKKNITATIVDRPQTVDLGRDARLEILYPDRNLAGIAPPNSNDSSIVSRLVYGRRSILLMADAEAETEKELLKKDRLRPADVLKVSHHGSDTGSGEEFLSEVRPQIAVISAGIDNKFGHPSPRVLKKLERTGARIYRTDRDGTIKVFIEGENLEIKAGR